VTRPSTGEVVVQGRQRVNNASIYNDSSKWDLVGSLSVTVIAPGQAPSRTSYRKEETPMELDELFEAADEPARLSKAALDIDNAE
jgi:hypothetical protein